MTTFTALQQRTITDYLDDVIESFLVDRRIQNVTAGTLYFYRFKLRLLSRYCASQQVSVVSQIDTTFMRSFLLWISESHNPGGCDAVFRACKSFFTWWENESGYVSPMRKIHRPRAVFPPLEPASIPDISRLLFHCNTRDKAIILTLLDTGLRASELLTLKVSDVTFNSGAVLVRHGKGNKSRTVFLGRRSRRAVREYVTQSGVDDNLFPFTYTGLRTMLQRRCRDAGIDYLSPHSFRRAFALSMLRDGCDIYTIQRLMGHADLQVLTRYLKQTDDDLRIQHGRHSPADRM